LYDYPEEEMDKLMNNLIYEPCTNCYLYTQDWQLLAQKHDKIMNTNFPIIKQLLEMKNN
jgi:hypothetical protein